MKLILFLAFVVVVSTHAAGQCPHCGKAAAAPLVTYNPTVSYGSAGSAQSYGSSGSSYSQPRSTGGYYGSIRSVQSSSLAAHLRNDHGVDTTGMSQSQMEAAHNRIHAGQSRQRYRLFGWRR